MDNPAAIDYVVPQPMLDQMSMRRDLQQRGVDIIGHYISETAANSRGINGTGVAYAQQLDLGASFDLQKLDVWQAAVGRFAVSDRAGRSLAQDKTSSLFGYQEIYGQGEIFRLDEISVEKGLLTGRIAAKIGFYPLGNDFATLPYVCSLTNAAFCGHPQSLPGNSGWSDGPAGRWGARAKWQLTPLVQFQVGVFDVNPAQTVAQNGLKLGLAGSTGVIIPAEISYQSAHNPYNLAGTYKVGGYYDSSTTPGPAATVTEDHRGRTGLYIEGAQELIKTGPGTGLAIFSIFTLADQGTAKFRYYYEAGCTYRGPFLSRPLDLVSVGWVRADINAQPQARQMVAAAPLLAHEQLLELSYTSQVTPSLQLRPDVQYDDRPGAVSTHPNTWVYAFQIKLTL